MSRPATLLVREVDVLMIYSHPIASDLPRGSKTASDQAKRLCAPPCPWSGDDDKARYLDFAARVVTDPTVFITIRDALKYLAIKIKAKNDLVMQVQTEAVDGQVRRYLPQVIDRT